MANTYTTNLSLAKPARGDTGWDDEINGNWDILDDNAITTLDSLTDVASITEAQGQVIYHDGSNWNALDPGADGEFLKTQGADANPVWAVAGGGWDGSADLAIANGVKLTGGYLRIGDGGTVSQCDGDGDLFVEDELEVRGTTRFWGNVDFAGSFTKVLGGMFCFPNDIYLWFSGNYDSRIGWNQQAGDDHLIITTKVGKYYRSGNIIICEDGDYNVDWGHVISDDPRLYIQSSDGTSTDDYISFWHDQTDANIEVGAGDLRLNLNDNAGASAVNIRDSDGAEVTSIDSDGTLDTVAYSVGGTAGCDFDGVVTNITVVKGIVTAAS